jgi:hypothetical protein
MMSGEHRAILNRLVWGSNPPESTKNKYITKKTKRHELD